MMNNEQDGYSALTEYIRNQMDTGTSVEKSIAEIIRIPGFKKKNIVNEEDIKNVTYFTEEY